MTRTSPSRLFAVLGWLVLLTVARLGSPRTAQAAPTPTPTVSDAQCLALRALPSLPSTERAELFELCSSKSSWLTTPQKARVQDAATRLLHTDWQLWVLKQAFPPAFFKRAAPNTDARATAKRYLDNVATCVKTPTDSMPEARRKPLQAARKRLALANSHSAVVTALKALRKACRPTVELGVLPALFDEDLAKGTAVLMVSVRDASPSDEATAELLFHDAETKNVAFDLPAVHVRLDDGESVRLLFGTVPAGRGFTLRVTPPGYDLPFYYQRPVGSSAGLAPERLHGAKDGFGMALLDVVATPATDTLVFIDGVQLAKQGPVRVPYTTTEACQGRERARRCFGAQHVDVFRKQGSAPPQLEYTAIVEPPEPDGHGLFRHTPILVDLDRPRITTLLDVDVARDCGAVDREALWKVGRQVLETSVDDRNDGTSSRKREFQDIRGLAAMRTNIDTARELLAPSRRRNPFRPNRPSRNIRDDRIRRGNADAPEPLRQTTEDKLDAGLRQLHREGLAEVVQLHVDCSEVAGSARYTVTARKLDIERFATRDTPESSANAFRAESRSSTGQRLQRNTTMVMRTLLGMETVEFVSTHRTTTINRSVRVEVKTHHGPELGTPTRRLVAVRAHRMRSSQADKYCRPLEDGDVATADDVRRLMDEGRFGAAVPVVPLNDSGLAHEIWPSWGGTIVVEAMVFDRAVLAPRPTRDNGKTSYKFKRRWFTVTDAIASPWEARRRDSDFMCIQVEDDMRGPLWMEIGFGKSYPAGTGRRRSLGYGETGDNRSLARSNQWARVRMGFDIPFWFKSATRLLLGGSLGYMSRTTAVTGSPSWSDFASDTDETLRIVRRSLVLAPHVGMTTHGCRAARGGRFSPCYRFPRKLYWKLLGSVDLDIGRVDLSEIPVEALGFRNGIRGDRAFDVDIGVSAHAVLGYRFSPHIAAGVQTSLASFGIDDFISRSHRGTALEDVDLGWMLGLHLGGYL